MLDQVLSRPKDSHLRSLPNPVRQLTPMKKISSRACKYGRSVACDQVPERRPHLPGWRSSTYRLKVRLTLRWREMDSNFRLRARMATVPSLRALCISLKLFEFRRRDLPTSRTEVSNPLPSSKESANHWFPHAREDLQPNKDRGALFLRRPGSIKDVSVVFLSRVDSRRACVDIQKKFAHQTRFWGHVSCIKR